MLATFPHILKSQVLRDTPPHPLSAAGTRLRAAAAATAEHAASASLAAAFPPPSPAVMALVRSEVGLAATTRSRWAAGRGQPPEEDGDLSQNAGTLADFARYWVERLEQVRGWEGRMQALSTQTPADGTPAPPPAGQARPEAQPPAASPGDDDARRTRRGRPWRGRGADPPGQGAATGEPRARIRARPRGRWRRRGRRRRGQRRRRPGLGGRAGR